MVRIEVKKDQYKLLHPRPVYVIAAGRFGKEVNVMAASWVSPVSDEPPKLALAMWKGNYTYNLIEKYGEFTVNIMSSNDIDKIFYVGSVSGRNIDKLASVKWSIAKGKKVNAPYITESMGHIECTVTNKVDCNEEVLYIADIVYAEVEEKYYNVRYGWDLRVALIPLHVVGKAFTKPESKFVFAKSISLTRKK